MSMKGLIQHVNMRGTFPQGAELKTIKEALEEKFIERADSGWMRPTDRGLELVRKSFLSGK